MRKKVSKLKRIKKNSSVKHSKILDKNTRKFRSTKNQYNKFTDIER